MFSGLLRFCFVATSFGLLLAQDPDSQASALPSFGTISRGAPGGLRGTVYAIPKDTTVLPDFEHDHIERIGEVWTDTLTSRRVIGVPASLG